jgi:secreted trypsin-like serine protease
MDDKPAHYVIAHVGRHNLAEDEQNSVAHKVWEIVLHEDWNFTSNDYDANIALLVLETEVNIENVGIVCLPPVSQDEVSGNGTVVGWGISEWSEANRKRHSSTPNEMQLAVVPSHRCFTDNSELPIISSNRTFCAGFMNQSKSVCQGDSGGGFYQYEYSSRRFNIVGITSSSVSDHSGCSSNTYSAFTDVSKFTDWIERNMKEMKEVEWKDVEFECSGR